MRQLQSVITQRTNRSLLGLPWHCSEAQDPLAAASELMPEAAALYRHAGDLSLKEGETIK